MFVMGQSQAGETEHAGWKGGLTFIWVARERVKEVGRKPCGRLRGEEVLRH